MTQTQTSHSTICNDTNTDVTLYYLQWHKHRHHILPSAMTQTQTSHSTICSGTNADITFYHLQWHKHRHYILPSAMMQTQTSLATICNDTNTDITLYHRQWHKHGHHILPSAITQTQTSDQMWGVGWGGLCLALCSQKITVACVLILSLSRFHPSMNEFAVHAGEEYGTMAVMTWQCSASETQFAESLLLC